MCATKDVLSAFFNDTNLLIEFLKNVKRFNSYKPLKYNSKYKVFNNLIVYRLNYSKAIVYHSNLDLLEPELPWAKPSLSLGHAIVHDNIFL